VAVKKNNPQTVIGILGCLGERLKSKLLEEEKIVDMVVGPDAYRDLPTDRPKRIADKKE
jgi:tRNA-2-methylthio-N6-dimethylallyladenosine synthase